MHENQELELNIPQTFWDKVKFGIAFLFVLFLGASFHSHEESNKTEHKHVHRHYR